MVEPTTLRDNLKQKIKKQPQKGYEAFAYEIDKINQGLRFQHTLKEMEAGSYYKRKYCLDTQVEQRSGLGEKTDEQSGERKRESKLKSKLIKHMI